MEQYKVQLDVFEGPLDLLLHLIKEYEIDIYDIPMATLTHQYLEYINDMKALELNVASEYLEMASELIKIKSAMLLPTQHYEETTEDDPREMLIEQLLEYQNYKQYAEDLNQMKNSHSRKFTKAPNDIERYIELDETLEVSLQDLLTAYQKAMNRMKKSQLTRFTIQRERVSREDAIQYLESKFNDTDQLSMYDLFDFNESKVKVVAVFVVLLECIKEEVVKVINISEDDFEIERLSNRWIR